VCDSNGKTVPLTLYTGAATSWYTHVSLIGKSSWPSYEVLDSAAELLLFEAKDDEQPALRVPLDLERGEVTVMH
jgi:hypothetical protein